MITTLKVGLVNYWNYRMRLLTILFSISLGLAANAQEERRTTTISKKIGLMPYEETKDYMVGNNGYGFFIQNVDDSHSICRIRIKIECDYGLGVVKPTKLTVFKLVIDQAEMEMRTDDTGLVDGLFRCVPGIDRKTIKVSVKKFEASYKVKSFPKIISMSEKQCW